ncbi:hypothetical protein [Natranaerobius thermophilus]|uniref:Uncharacterized protein n=1 Tax=Natranaerobius thermophilus (strain ATCC BAA-1301 / DSM 18059 / JW/NM-WN-LF) TaxID=457570 RepID=B2A6A8_NATTJ|nr:hypothetical protein [Natranaerobius thermophilus]ACB84119.1 hypothetical protein Nther_0523 [Natranaerobius thermophilus JW/NM-WN-LF]
MKMFSGTTSKKRPALRSRLKRHQVRRTSGVSRKSRSYDKEDSFIKKVFWEIHRDLPRKIVLSIIIFLMIYFTYQINQGWSRQVIEFVHRVTTQQPDYSRIVNQIVEDDGVLDEIEILPVIDDDSEEEVFDIDN